jgi:hypothetical protein
MVWFVSQTHPNKTSGPLPRDFDPASVQKNLDPATILASFELRLSRVLYKMGNARFIARSNSFAPTARQAARAGKFRLERLG